MTETGAIVVLGDVMEDIIVRPDGPMVRGSDVRADIRALPGGSAANQAMWLAHLGQDVRLVARVGATDLDRQSHRFMARGVSPVFTGDAELATGRLVTLVDGDGERSFFTDRGANTALAPEDISPDVLAGAGLVHISGYAYFEPSPRAAAQALCDAARAAGIARSIDPSSVGFLAEIGAAVFIGWTAGIEMIFANQDEAALLSGSDDLDEQVRLLGAHYGLVIVKRGAAGAVAGTCDGILAQAAAVPVSVVDTTGAGDAFLAGFIAAQQGGADLVGALNAGAVAGAEAASRIGGQPD